MIMSVRLLLRRVLASAAGLALAGGPVAAQTPVPPQAAPPAWNAYAQEVLTALKGWLAEDADPARRLRVYLDAMRPTPDAPTPPVVLKLWIDRDGVVAKVDFPGFAHAQANDDLRACVVGRRLASSPPADLPMPIRLQVQLAAPDADNEGGGASPKPISQETLSQNASSARLGP